MAAGDTIPGQMRIIRSSEHGEEIMLAATSTTQLDRKDAPEKALFLNKRNAKVLELIQPHLDSPGLTPRVTKIHAGEVLKLQHLSSALEEAADYDADEFFISVIEVDHNYNVGDSRRARVRELNVADTELTANPTTSTSTWTTVFQDTVPNRKSWHLGGPLMVAAVEVA